MAVLVYFIVHCILQKEIHIQDFLRGLHDFQTLGNPSWFILMTLLTYLLTWLAFKAVGQQYPVAATAVLTVILLISIQIVNWIKPLHWINTLLCFPAGMLYYLKGEQVEQMLKKSRIPSIIYAFILLGLGLVLYHLKHPVSVYVQNIGGILFAVGVTWFAGSFTWKAPSRILIWLGGSGLFSVYMFHMLPMRIMTHYELNLSNPYLVWLTVILSAGILAAAANSAYNRMNKAFFSKQ